MKRLLALGVAPLLVVVGLSACDPAPDACLPEPEAFEGHPNPAKVGLPDDWTPVSTHSGDLTITTPNTVVAGTEVTGSINVMADGVMICDTRVHGRIWNQWNNPETGNLHQWNFIVKDSTIGEPDGSAAEVTQHGAIGPGRYVAVRNEVYGSDGFRVSEPHQGGGTDVIIHDNFFKATPSGDLHLDGVQGFFGGQNVTVTHNTIDVDGPSNNGAIFFADCSESAIVRDNVLNGGSFTLRIHDDNGNPPPASSFNCGQPADVGPWEITGNRIVNESWDFGPALTTNTNCATTTWSDNRRVTIDADYQVTSLGLEVGC